MELNENFKLYAIGEMEQLKLLSHEFRDIGEALRR